MWWARHEALWAEAVFNLVRGPGRCAVVLLCLIAMLTPLAAGLAIHEGIRSQYADVVRQGADLYITGDSYGSNAPLPINTADRIAALQGITRVVPRVIGRTYAKGKFFAILGVDANEVPAPIHVIAGHAPSAAGEVMIGRQAAKHLNISPGTKFSLARDPDKTFHIAGLFASPCTAWEADLLVMGRSDAADLFGMPDMATDLQVWTRPGYEKIIDSIIRLSEDTQGPPLRVQTKDLVGRYTQRGFNTRAGVFSGFWVVVLVLGIPCIGIISGFGTPERHRITGVMKALGWQTREILELIAIEHLILAFVSVPLVLVASIIWIYAFGGCGLVGFFIPNIEVLAPFAVPWQLLPVPALPIGMLALVLTMVGSLYSTWRAAVVPPVEAMRT